VARFGIATGAFVDERDDWNAAVARAAAEEWPYVELTAIFEERFDELLARPPALDAFERVSLHAPVVFRTSPDVVAQKLVSTALPFDVVLHPNVYVEQTVLRELGRRAVFENMDVAKSFGRGVADLRSVFAAFPDAGFCLDVAHVWTNDVALRLGLDLLDELGDRLRQLHVSGIEPDGTHRPTTADDLVLYAPLLERCTHVPWLLEAELASG